MPLSPGTCMDKLSSRMASLVRMNVWEQVSWCEQAEEWVSALRAWWRELNTRLRMSELGKIKFKSRNWWKSSTLGSLVSKQWPSGRTGSKSQLHPWNLFVISLLSETWGLKNKEVYGFGSSPPKTLIHISSLVKVCKTHCKFSWFIKSIYTTWSVKESPWAGSRATSASKQE